MADVRVQHRLGIGGRKYIEPGERVTDMDDALAARLHRAGAVKFIGRKATAVEADTEDGAGIESSAGGATITRQRGKRA